MQLSVLLKSLRGLKLQLEESISIAEAKRVEDVDDKLVGLIEQCKNSLSAIWLIVHGPPVAKFENTVPGTNHLLHENVEQDQSFDNLEDVDFDDFFEKPQQNEVGKKCSSTSSDKSKQSFKQDKLFDIDSNDDKRLQDDMIEKSATELNDFDSFNDSDFDDEALIYIERAEKNAKENVLYVDEDEPDNIHQPSDSRYQEVLKQYFGYSMFRPLQWKIIDSVLNGKRDNCVIMATGYGKSLTFQFPSVFTKHTSVIISPLISLMEDQVRGLQASNIEACFLGSAQSEMTRTKQDMFSGRYRLVYVTPEYATVSISDFKKLDEQVGIDLIAIDEAHCVSQWGHDFRESYRKLGILKQEFPKIPILAVTATATFEVQKDICSSLKLVNPNMTCTGFDRPNLFLTVSPKTGDIATDLKNAMQKVGYKFCFDGPTIIYCPTKKVTEEVTKVLNGLGVQCLPYHASLTLPNRRKAHYSFLNDEIQVVVATVAFGMGIDKPDVRRVIHYGAPKDIESYYQEIGRAGRDGLPGICTTLFSKTDFNISRHFISTINNEKFRDHKMKMLHKMEQYLTTSLCRRRILLSYFEAGNLAEIGGTEKCCDNCCSKIAQLHCGATISNSCEKTIDYRKEAIDLFRAIDATGNRYGLQVPIQVLTGSERQKVQAFKSNKMFGLGKYKSTRFWTALGKALIFEGYLREKLVQGGFGFTVETTSKASLWLNQVKNVGDKCHLFITPSGELLQEEEALMKKSLVVAIKPSQAYSSSSGTLQSNLSTSLKVSAAQLSTSLSSSTTQSVSQPCIPPVDERTSRLQIDLYIKLMKARNNISQETGFTPHNIASNKVLIDMAKFRPSMKSSLLKLEDFSEVKADRFGECFLELIKSFCGQNSLKMDDFPTAPNASIIDDSMKDDLMKITETQRQSYIMFTLEKISLEEVASRRALKVSTVITHLCEALKEGLSVDVRQLGVTEKIENLITKSIWAPPLCGGISSLTKVKDQLPDYVEYNHIKIVIALLVQKHGQEVNNSGELVLHKDTSHDQSITVIDVPDDTLDDSSLMTCSTPRQGLKRQRTLSPASVSLASSEISSSLDKSPESRSSEQPTLQKAASESQSSSQNITRKLPLWIAAPSNKTLFKKKIKSNSLFK